MKIKRDNTSSNVTAETCTLATDDDPFISRISSTVVSLSWNMYINFYIF